MTPGPGYNAPQETVCRRNVPRRPLQAFIAIEVPALNLTGSPASAQTVAPPAQRQTVLWVIALLLAVIATALVLRLDESAMHRNAAWGQSPSGTARLGARGISAFSGQITRNTFGIFMLDVDSGTIWCYELTPGVDGAKQLRLVAARSWIFDRYLEEFNVTDPTPAAVAELVDKQVSQKGKLPSTNGLEGLTTQPSGRGGTAVTPND